MSTAPLRPRTSWWRLNRWALLSLVVLIPLVIVASSFRYFAVYRMKVPSTPIQPQDGKVRIVQDVLTPKQVWKRDVTVTLDDVAAAQSDGAIIARPGAHLFVIDLTLAAPSDSPLEGCRVEIVDTKGRRYSPYGARVSRDDSMTAGFNGCLPAKGSKGPLTEWDGNLINEGPPRVASWQVHTSVAVTDGAEIKELRVWWDPPQYASFPVKG